MATAFITIAFGLAVGSFMNVVMDRVPAGESIGGRSECDRCRRRLRWWELVPVISALALRYRCPACGGRIPLRYTTVELGTAVVFLAVLARNGGVTVGGVAEALGLTALGALALIDLRERVVPDAVSIPAIVAVGVLHAVALRAPLAVLLSVVLGAGFFALQRVVSRGRWVGDGDTRVGALMGATVPLPLLAVGIGSAYIIGGIVAAALLASRRVERHAHIPLVPFLFVGALFAVFAGDVILGWYGV